jgi:uncharacterized protein
MNSYFRSYSGKRVHPLSPVPEEIEIGDIAHSLANICRFLGHTKGFYSVAQHCVLVSQFVPPADALWGLLHDAAEAYLCDLPRPVKREPQMHMYRDAEDRLLACVAVKFGLEPEMPDSVKQADRVLLATEFRDVTTVSDLDWIVAECGVEPLDHRMHIIDPWSSSTAEDNFLRRFRELTK